MRNPFARIKPLNAKPSRLLRGCNIWSRRARLDQIINMKHELVRLAEEIDWAWLDDELAKSRQRQGSAGDRDPLHDRLNVITRPDFTHLINDYGICVFYATHRNLILTRQKNFASVTSQETLAESPRLRPLWP